jgi:hypothetical protein
MTSRASLTPGRKRPGPTKSHARQDRAATADPPKRKPKRRKSSTEDRPRRKNPRIPASGAKNRPRGTEPEIPENDPENAPPDGKLPEIRNARKAIRKTRHAAKRPQITAFGAKNRSRGTQPENSENDPDNSPPDGKLPENRNAEKAIRKTRCAARSPKILKTIPKNLRRTRNRKHRKAEQALTRTPTRPWPWSTPTPGSLPMAGW